MSQSLFYEYAMTPDIFDADYLGADARLEVILPEILKGISQNGMIANLHKEGWIKHIESERLPTIQAAELKDRLLRIFSYLKGRNRLVRHPKSVVVDPTTDPGWMELALESHQHIKFDAIISSATLIAAYSEKCSELIDCLQALSSGHWENRRRTLTLQSNEQDYRPVLDPLLRHARSLTIVDPYFSPHHQKYLNFIKICIEQMGKRGQAILPGRIRIHTGDPTKDQNNSELPKDRLNSWEQEIKKLVTSKTPHKIQVFLRGRKTGGKKFHDRFILTDQCCIEIPMGTDTFELSTPHSTTWSLLDYEDMQLKAQEIDPAMGIYDVLGERVIF